MSNCAPSRKLRLFSVRSLVGLLVAWALLFAGVPAKVKAQGTESTQSSELANLGAASLNDEQPIAYSHRLHAGDLQIQCAYCHSGAKRSAMAGVPAVGVCTGCHRWVKDKTPEMKKVDDYERRQQPIFWKRINQLDDYVYFSHKRHVSAGLECQGCHGPVKTMERVQRIEKLTMGWCVTCHEQRRAPLDCSTCHR